MGIAVGIRIRTDSSSAKAFASKPGFSKMKHIQLRHAFLQQLVQEGLVVLEKTPTAENPADVLTKPLDEAGLIACLKKMGALQVVQRTAEINTILVGREAVRELRRRAYRRP